MSQRVGTNMMLAATLACLSYVPFEYVAKGSLLFAVLLFIMDPIPPVSRLLSLVLVVVVGAISKMHRRCIQEETEHEENGITIVIDDTHQHDETKSSSDTNAIATAELPVNNKKDN